MQARRTRTWTLAAASLVLPLAALAESSPRPVIAAAAGPDTVGPVASWAQFGSLASATRSQPFGLRSYGAALGWHERLEVTLSQQTIDPSPALALQGVAPFGMAPGQHLRMNVLGMKLRVAGDAAYDGDNLWPQIAVGLQYKTVQPGSLGAVQHFLGARTRGTDVYVSATKLFLAQGLLVNATLRGMRADSAPGSGLAVPGREAYSLRPEFSVAYLLQRNLAIGAEYRLRPVQLTGMGRAAGWADALADDESRDVYVAWAPAKNLSLSLAYVGQGRTVPGLSMQQRQSGTWFSAQFAF